MQNPINPAETLGTIAFIVLTSVLLLFESIVAFILPFLVGLAGLIVGLKMQKSNYKDSPVMKQLAKLYGFRVHNCGCVYEPNTSRHITNVPNSEWIDKEKVYERSMDGAKVKFSKKKAGMKRCTQCGNHYHIVEGFNLYSHKHSRTCWPEEEPDVREELNHRVIES